MANLKSFGHASLQLFSVTCALAVLLLFPILREKVLPLPTKYSIKTTQQLVNFLVVLSAKCLSLLMKSCLEFTNEAETASNLVNDKLTLTRLQVHTNASKQSYWGMLKVAWYDSAVRKPAVFYLFTLAAFGGLTWVLSIIFVLDYGRRTQGIIQSRPITLSSDIPAGDDACSSSITSGNCTYDLAVSALSSQLITHTPYTISSIQFSPPFGTQGLPFDVLDKFSKDVETDAFGGQLLRQYCLPVLQPKSVSCQQDTAGTRASYSTAGTVAGLGVYEVTINPNTAYAGSHVRVSFQNGTMTIAQSAIPSEPEVTIITASNIYADVLSQLMYGRNSTTSIFTVVCTINPQSSWQWISLYYDQGVYKVKPQLGEYHCNSGHDSSFTGFTNLYYAIQGATRVVNAIDGYSKYINSDVVSAAETQQDDQLYAEDGNMSLLESILSQLYEIVQTSYSGTLLTSSPTTSIPEVRFRTAYVITVQWSAASILALLMALTIFLATILPAWLYFRAMRLKKRKGGVESKLLDVMELMAYSAHAAEEVGPALNTNEKVEQAKKGRTNLVLRAY